MNKKVLVVAAVIVLLPLLYALRRPPVLTVEKVRAAFKRNGMDIAHVKAVQKPAHGALAEEHFTVNGALVQLFHFEDQRKMNDCYELYRDPREARKALQRLSSVGIAVYSLGPTIVGRNDWIVLTISTDRENLRNHVMTVFKSL